MSIFEVKVRMWIKRIWERK